MIAAFFGFLFAFSLLPGREPLCMKFARRVSGGLVPEGAEEYCRKLTWIWVFACFGAAAMGAMSVFGSKWWCLSYLAVPGLLFAEKLYRNRRFKVVFHTSGSTGGPKTIVKPFERLAKEVVFHSARWRGLEGKPVLLATIHPDHMYGTLWRKLLPELLGWECDPEIIVSPESLVAKMAAAKSVFLVTTPSFLSRFCAYASQYEVPRNCVEIITSGALLKDETSASAKAVFGVEPLQIYGSTETGGIASRRGGGVWEVFPAVKISSDGGRLRVKSPYSTPTAYTLGDGVEIIDQTHFRLLGRMDRLVKINEERVNLAEMEEAVCKLGFKEAALAVIEGERGPMLGLMVAGEKIPPLKMREMLGGIFPKGTIPKKFRFVDELPRNSQGKVVAQEVKNAFAL